MNNLLKEALAWRSKANSYTRRHLPGLLEEAGLDPQRDGVELTLEPSLYVDDHDVEKPRVFLSLAGDEPAVSIQIEPENATPDEIRRLVPYLKSFLEQEEGFDMDINTAEDVALPYSDYDDPVVLFVDGSCAGRLPVGLTFEEASDAANERQARALGGVL